ncbi:GNAT family N-acetyltransferase [Jeongeupia naejangsanensis]|uniref:GNAT family N-acetyltransferase n=1 Tax=Jeongeupia naejangsanensis TaxID=613195 RepID=A0ABS2BJW8_9NEIS|nr:GNAT family N-acetyltransferase [Jeongeupia naejangsanensis]MBM3115720.1 GNAT family N-acetyltransferase [Jeongeupia naejangsanensis]
MSTHHLRTAGTGDFPVLRALLLASYAEFIDQLPEADGSAMAANIASAVGRAAGQWWLMEHDGAPAGCILYGPPGTEASLFPSDWAFVRLLGVAPPARGQGVSRQLMRHCIALARSQQAPAIGLYTSDWMQPAQQLYASLGFAGYGELPGWYGLRYRTFRLDLSAPAV